MGKSKKRNIVAIFNCDDSAYLYHNKEGALKDVKKELITSGGENLKVQIYDLTNVEHIEVSLDIIKKNIGGRKDGRTK